jgi:peptidoglycan/LPS O-acetylase OafA/YrhL
VDVQGVERPSDRFLRRFARITTAGRRFIPEIDGMRFVAIGMVVVVHSVSTVYKLTGGATRFPHPPEQDPVWWLGQEGVWGVYLFFVISGFILALPFAGRRLRVPGARPVVLGSYYLRRLTRLEPPYLVGLTLALVGAVVIGGASLGELLPHYAAGMGYLHGTIFGTLNPVFLVSWSLEVEVQFYLVVPLLAMLFSLRSALVRRVAVVALAASALVLALVVDPLPTWAAYSLVPYLPYFLVGFLLADVYLVDWGGSVPGRRGSWDAVALASAVAFVCLAYGPPHSPVGVGWLTVGRETLREVVFPPLAFVFFLAALRGRWSSRWLSNRWVFTIGGMCYSIYLTHTLVIDVARKLTLHAVIGHSLGMALLVQVILLAPIVLAVGAAFFLLVERPCMDPRWPWTLAARLGGGQPKGGATTAPPQG